MTCRIFCWLRVAESLPLRGTLREPCAKLARAIGNTNAACAMFGKTAGQRQRREEGWRPAFTPNGRTLGVSSLHFTRSNSCPLQAEPHIKGGLVLPWQQPLAQSLRRACAKLARNLGVTLAKQARQKESKEASTQARNQPISVSTSDRGSE